MTQEVVMATRGPVPKRTDQRRRVNKPEMPVVQVTAGSIASSAPEPDELWHPLARDWFLSLAKSGQAQFFEASDWSQARVWAHLLSVELFKEKPSAMMVSAWASGAGELLTTEGARRRLRIELERKKVADPGEDHAMATVTDLADRLGG
jgi:hypothetical protein